MGNKTPIIAKKDMMLAVIAGIISGLFYISPAFNPSLGSFLSIFSGVFLFVAGFGFGTAAVIIASLTGFAVSAVVAPASLSGIFYLVVNGIPVTVAVALVLRAKDKNFTGLGTVAAGLTGYIAALFIGYDLYQAASGTTLQEYLAKLLTDQVDNTINANPDIFAGLSDKEIRDRMIAEMKAVMLSTANIYPGIFMFSAFLATAVNAFIAMYILNNSSRGPLRKEFGFNNLALPHWVAAVTVITVTGAALTTGHIGFVLTNLAMLFITLEMIEGLAVIHNLAARKDEKTKKRILWLVYLVIGGMFFPLFIIGMIGIADHIKNFRGLKK